MTNEAGEILFSEKVPIFCKCWMLFCISRLSSLYSKENDHPIVSVFGLVLHHHGWKNAHYNTRDKKVLDFFILIFFSSIFPLKSICDGCFFFCSSNHYQETDVLSHAQNIYSI